VDLSQANCGMSYASGDILMPAIALKNIYITHKNFTAIEMCSSHWIQGINIFTNTYICVLILIACFHFQLLRDDSSSSTRSIFHR